MLIYQRTSQPRIRTGAQLLGIGNPSAQDALNHVCSVLGQQGFNRPPSRHAFQVITRCCDPCLRCGWQRDRDARAQGQFQRVV